MPGISQSQRRTGTGIHAAKVVPMGPGVRGKTTAVTIGVVNALADGRRRGLPYGLDIAARPPELWANVVIAEDERRKTGNRVVPVGDAPLDAPLCKEPCCEIFVTDPRGAICVQVNGETVATKVGGAKSCDSRPKRVPSGHDPEIGVT